MTLRDGCFRFNPNVGSQIKRLSRNSTAQTGLEVLKVLAHQREVVVTARLAGSHFHGVERQDGKTVGQVVGHRLLDQAVKRTVGRVFFDVDGRDTVLLNAL